MTNDARSSTKVDKHISMRLRVRRVEQEFSQSEIGERVGVTFQQIQKYENGKNRISAGRLYQLAEILKVQVGYFFVGLDCTGDDDEVSILTNLINSSTGMSLAKVFSKLTTRDRRAIFTLARSLTEPMTARPSKRASDGRPDDPFNGQRPVSEIIT